MARMKTSPKLAAFLQDEFESMVRASEHLEEQRKEYRKGKARKTTAIRRAAHQAEEQERKQLEYSKLVGKITAEQLEQLKKSLSRGYEQQMRQKLKDLPKDPIMETKAHLDFKNFVWMFYYLSKKENPSAKRADVLREIEDFLKDRDYAMKSGRPYDANDMGRIINEFEKNDALRKINSLIDHSFESYQRPGDTNPPF
jgi:hypothetical protein